MTEYAIGTYEINLLQKDDLKKVFEIMQPSCKWIDTAIDYDNDYLFPSIADKDTKIITKISSCHFDDYELFVTNHLKYLKRDKVDMMLIHSNRGDWMPLAKRIVKDDRFIHKGVSNFTATDLQSYHDLTGEWPYANEIEINPFYTDIEAINFCKEKGIKIISYAILGGKYNSWQNVAHYGLGNLVAYAAKYADIVICRANSSTEAEHFVDIIQNFNFKKAAKITLEDGDKAIEPMRYTSPSVYNFMFGKPTYLREFGSNDNKVTRVKSAQQLKLVLPKFEMLGDYKTFLRYMYRNNGYFGDWLDLGDNKYLAIYLWDKDHKLTKVSPNAEIEVWEYECN